MNAMSGQDGLRYRDLGTLAIERHAVSQPVRGQRVSAILAALLIRANQPVSSDALIEAVWSGSPPDGAATTLESHLWRLRQALEPDHQRGQPFTTVVHDGTGYRLAATDEQVDSLLFEKLTGEAHDLLVTDQPGRALTRCDDALALWRGEPWAPHSDELWATASTSRMHQLRAQLRRHRIECLLQMGNPETALNDLDPLLDDEPLDERLWSMAMLAAYRLGRVGQALETYTRARRTLIEEAGIEPGQQLRDLQAKILDRDQDLTAPTGPVDVSSARQPEIHLPVRRAELIGRDSEVAAVIAAVSAHQLVTVVGPAGCGKTRLVIEAAREAAPSFPDGVWFVDLTAAKDHGQLLDAITSALGLSPPEVGTVTDALWSFAGSRRMLLVLDNCEHLLDDVAELLDLALGQRSELALLTTSREPLAIDGEHVHNLSPLAVPSLRDLDHTEIVAEIPAVRLFLQRLHVTVPHFNTAATKNETGGDADTVRLAAQICQAVDGLPLAIELAAGQARSYTLDEILARVRSDSASLARTGRGGPRHHATLAGAIKLSVDTLTPDERTLHQAIAVIPGPLTTDLAAHLTGNSVGDAAARLANLAYRSMLTPLTPLRLGGPSRFSQLATIRDQSLAVLTPDSRQRLQQRRDAWVADLIADGPKFGHAGEGDWFSRIDDNLAAVRATLHHGLVEEPNTIGAFVASRLELYWIYRGMLLEWERWTGLAAASPAAEPFDRLTAGCSHVQASILTRRGGLAGRWMDDLEVYPLPLSKDQQAWLVHYMLSVMLACHIMGDIEEGRRAATLMRQLADSCKDPDADLMAEVAEVLTLSQTGDPTTVLPRIDEVWQHARRAKNRYATWAAAAAGMISGAVGNIPAAGLRWSEILLDVFEQAGAEHPTMATEMRGMLLAADGQPYESIRAIARSRALARRSGERWPLQPETTQILQAAQASLPAAEAERAYKQGLLGHDRS